MWPLKLIFPEKRTPLQVLTHIYGVSNEIERKTFIFRVNLVMWTLKSIILEKKPCFECFNTHLLGFQEDRWEKIQLFE